MRDIPRSIWTDEEYRKQRVAQLLDGLATSRK
jgi:hypothetical protein